MFLSKQKSKKSIKALILMAPFVLTGCSSVPDAANPVEWYRSSVEYFTEEEPEETSNNEVVEAAATDPEASEENQVPSGFVAAEQPQYAPQVARQGEIVNPLGNTAIAQNQPPAPVAAPSSSVQSAQLGEVRQVTPETMNQQVAANPQQPQNVNNVVGQRLDPAASPRDNRSIGEIFASNISQQRPTDTGTRLRSLDTLSLGGHSFDTVVVSSSGVAREPASARNLQQPQQVASLSNSFQTTSRQVSSLMAAEPELVKQGRAVSLSNHNPGQFTGTFQVATIQFGNGSAQLTGEDQRILREVLSIHQQQGGIVRVVGHASSRTRDMTPEEHRRVNMQVSLLRADIVGAELLKIGMNPQRLFVGGVSDNVPLYREVMPSGEAGNRRTEIFIDY